MGPDAQAPKYTESAVLMFVRSGSTWRKVARFTPSESVKRRLWPHIALRGTADCARGLWRRRRVGLRALGLDLAPGDDACR